VPWRKLFGRGKPFVSLWRLPLGFDRFLRPALCEQLTAVWVPAIVENKPGAGAIIAIETVAAGWLHAAMTTSARFGRTACCTAAAFHV
jgi:hypothetical protein